MEEQHQGHAAGLDQSTTMDCIEKVEAMISTAILHQEDAWNLLIPQAQAELFRGHSSNGSSSTASVPEAVKESLEKAMDWCRLAQCRLKDLIDH